MAFAQSLLDGVGEWGGKVVDAYGQNAIDRIRGAEATTDANQPESETGPPDPKQQAAAALPTQLASAKNMMILGGVALAIVAVSAMWGARK